MTTAAWALIAMEAAVLLALFISLSRLRRKLRELRGAFGKLRGDFGELQAQVRLLRERLGELRKEFDEVRGGGGGRRVALGNICAATPSRRRSRPSAPALRGTVQMQTRSVRRSRRSRVGPRSQCLRSGRAAGQSDAGGVGS